MATKFILALIFSSLFILQVSSDSKKNEEASQALHVFSRGEGRKLMHNWDVVIPRAPSLAPAPSPSSEHADCGGLCKHRCSLHSRQRLCIRACGTCCERCKCVPPGTSGNREMCGKCYTDMTTHGNKTKCP